MCPDADTVAALVEGRLPTEEAARIQAHAAECEQCRQLISALAASARGPGETLVDRPSSISPPPEDPASSALPALGRGDTVGRYLIVERLAKGGMGVVYAAYDPDLDRRVALKVLRTNVADVSPMEMQMRLQREAQAMARLAHPNVVAVHDVGTFRGQVFLTMEFVEGQTLKAWLKKEKRSWKEVRDAFVQAARGLAAAHEVGLVHRDFKPENALYGNDGRVRVLDFGLARAQAAGALTPSPGAPELGSVPVLSTDLTEAGQVMGTPAYMAPEQMQGGATDARSDQFSFCVALFEALYGKRPFHGADLDERLENVRGGKIAEVPRGEVPAWLHAAVMRGLAVDPGARHSSMAALIAALQSDASPWKARWGVAGAVGAVLVASSAAMAVVLRPADLRCKGAERRLAGVWDPGRRAALRAAFEASGKPYAPDALRSTLKALDGWSRAWVGARTEACEATLHGEQSEAARDLRMGCLDRALVELDEQVRVLSARDAVVLESAANAARSLVDLRTCADLAALQRKAAPEPPELHEELEGLRRKVASAKALTRAGKFKDAEQVARDVLAAVPPLDPPLLRAEARVELGVALQHLAEYPEAEAVLHEAAADAARAGDDALAGRAWLALADLTGRELSRYAEGARWADHADAWISRAGQPAELSGERRRILGFIAMQQGKYQEALEYDERALADLERALGADHPTVAAVYNSEGGLLNLLGRTEPAIAALQKALAVRRAVFGDTHPLTANTLANLAQVYSDSGRYEEADRAQSEALKVYAASYGEDHPETAGARLSLAIFRSRQGRGGEAIGLFEQAIPVLERTLGAEHPTVGVALGDLGGALITQGAPARAILPLRRGISILEKSGPTQPYLPMFLTALGHAQLETGNERAARPLLERARAQLEATQDADPFDRAYNAFVLARALSSDASMQGRARALAGDGRAATAKVRGPAEREELDRLDKWLKMRGD